MKLRSAEAACLWGQNTGDASPASKLVGPRDEPAKGCRVGKKMNEDASTKVSKHNGQNCRQP